VKSKTAEGAATRLLEQYRAQGRVADIEVYNKAIVENQLWRIGMLTALKSVFGFFRTFRKRG
jgi:hypothetical protein